MARGRAGSGGGKRRTCFSPGTALAALIVVAAMLALAACDIGSGQPAGSATADTAATQPTTTPAAAATDSPTVAATPAAAPPRAVALPADPCHAGGVTYCVLNPNVTQATIGSTICVSGWTATVRPPESYTYNLKVQQMAHEGLPGTTRDYEEDHRMPLELGGAPSAVMNLSPESPPSPNPKDSAETSLKYDVCDGRMTLVQAQGQMVSTWLAAYPRYRR